MSAFTCLRVLGLAVRRARSVGLACRTRAEARIASGDHAERTRDSRRQEMATSGLNDRLVHQRRMSFLMACRSLCSIVKRRLAVCLSRVSRASPAIAPSGRRSRHPLPLLAPVACPILLLLASCQTAPPQVVIGSAKPVEIRVPVVQPCLAQTDIESMPATAMPPRTENVEALAAGAYADATRYRELARRQQEQLKACASVNPQGAKP